MIKDVKFEHVETTHVRFSFKGGYFTFIYNGHVTEFTKEMFIGCLIDSVWAIRYWDETNEFDLLKTTNGNYRRINSIKISLEMMNIYNKYLFKVNGGVLEDKNAIKEIIAEFVNGE